MALKTYPIGIHPKENKELSLTGKVLECPLPSEVIIPLSQHIGKPAKPVVAVGDKVKAGTKIAEADGAFSANIHSSISGEVKAIGNFPHPLTGMAQAIHIVSDGLDEKEAFTAPSGNPMEFSREQLIKIITEAGIVGMGGAGFPTSIKLSPPDLDEIDCFILNGVECEPYLTCDDMLMRRKVKEILEAMLLVMKILDVKKGRIAIEANKMEAIASFREQLLSRRIHSLYSDSMDITVEVLKVQYPHGAEKQLIKTVTGREVPSGGLPKDVGCVVDNVGTLFAIYEAVKEGKPLFERMLTVSGSGVKSPDNIMARVGTTFADIIECCGGTEGDITRVLMGGPMMGITQSDLNVPIIKTTSGILLFTKEEEKIFKRYPCIRCARCVDVCPASLSPTDIARFTEAKQHDRAEDFFPMDCIECGNCSYVCPSRIPLVQFIRAAKNNIRAKARRK